MAGITFETVYAGLDRALTLRKDKYDTTLQLISSLKNEDEAAVKRLSDTSASETFSRVNKHYNDLVAQYSIDHNVLIAQQVEAERELQGQRAVSPEAQRLSEQISSKNMEREQVIAERDKSIKDKVDEFEHQRSSFDARIKLAQDRNDNDALKRLQIQEDALANPRHGIEMQYAPRIEALDKDLSNLRTDFDKAQSVSAPMSAMDRQKLDGKLQDIKAQLAASDAKWEGLLTEARKQISDSVKLEASNSSNEIAISQRREEIRSQIDKLEKQRIEGARLDQIRRIAARFYGAKPEDVSSDRVDFISNIWFGSLAMLAALAGPMTALVSLELQDLAAQQSSLSRRRPLATLARRLLLSWRWRRVKTVKSPYPVTVEKEVEKRVEVIVEKVIKEILYVPILTDDPDAVRQLLDSSLESEVAGLVKVSLMRSVNGNPA